MNTNSYKAGWMQTFTGRSIHPIEPTASEINLTDIAAALSKMCRYGGHCLRFYSVAEHCVLAACAAPDHLKLTALMHDASEAYLVDIPRPLKGKLQDYYTYENQLMKLISQKFDFQWPLPREVTEIDMALLRDERKQNMAPMACPSELWGDMREGTGQLLQFWGPDRAYSEFIKAYYAYAEANRHVA